MPVSTDPVFQFDRLRSGSFPGLSAGIGTRDAFSNFHGKREFDALTNLRCESTFTPRDEAQKAIEQYITNGTAISPSETLSPQPSIPGLERRICELRRCFWEGIPDHQQSDSRPRRCWARLRDPSGGRFTKNDHSRKRSTGCGNRDEVSSVIVGVMSPGPRPKQLLSNDGLVASMVHEVLDEPEEPCTTSHSFAYASIQQSQRHPYDCQVSFRGDE